MLSTALPRAGTVSGTTRFSVPNSKRWQNNGKKGKLLNIGCAHGPDFIPFRANFELYGIDSSLEMLHYGQKYAGKYDFEPYLALADASHLPFLDESFDWAISVATYHHLRDKTARLNCIEGT